MLVSVAAEQESVNSLGWFALLIQSPQLKPWFRKAPELSASISLQGSVQHIPKAMRPPSLQLGKPKMW